MVCPGWRPAPAVYAWFVALTFIFAVEIADHWPRFLDAGYVLAFGEKAIVPLAACGLLIAGLIWLRDHARFDLRLQYPLFFAISATSALGLTKTLTGSHAGSSNVLLYGLSFYTATLAYHTMRRSLAPATALAASNPLLLVTGPIATFLREAGTVRCAPA